MRIHVIETGGTINGILSPDEAPPARSLVLDWLGSDAAATELSMTADIVCMKDSRAITEQDRAALVAAIEASDHDFILVPHGTWTMPETGRYLLSHLSMTGLDKTVLLVGALQPLGEPNSDAPDNLAFALDAFPHAPAGVWIAMQKTLWNPSEVIKDEATGCYRQL